MAMLPIPPVEERTMVVNDARSMSRMRSYVFMSSVAAGVRGHG